MQFRFFLFSPAVPKMLSDFLTKVPSVLLYASAPPINEYAAVSSANITSVPLTLALCGGLVVSRHGV